MSRSTSTKVIVSLASGSGNTEDISENISALFAALGLPVDLSLAKTGAEVAELARAAAHEDWKAVVAGGGDGTINSVASQIAGTGKIFGVLPLGTLNHFARDLNIPNDLDEAAKIIALGRVIDVDVGEVNGHIFLNNSSLGLYPTIVRERVKQERLGSSKWPAFVWAALRALSRYPFLDVRLNVDGKELRRRTPFVFIGNNEYVMVALNIGRRERLDRGHLSLYITNRTGRWGLMRLALRALLGRLKNDKDFLALRASEVTIETRHKRLRVAFDGEVDIIKGPLHYRIRPKALRVFVPGTEKA